MFVDCVCAIHSYAYWLNEEFEIKTRPSQGELTFKKSGGIIAYVNLNMYIPFQALGGETEALELLVPSVM